MNFALSFVGEVVGRVGLGSLPRKQKLLLCFRNSIHAVQK